MNKTVSILSLPSATGFGTGDKLVGVSNGEVLLFPHDLIGSGVTGSGATGATGVTGPTGAVSNSDRLINGNLELILDSKGTLNTPLLLPTSFTAICDESHMIDSVAFEGSDWWEFEVEFQVSTYGTVAVMINNIFPILTNPGYVSGYTFRFTEADHGIPNYNFDITLNDVVLPGGAGWTSNLAVSQAPVYPSTIESLGAIKITSNSNSMTLKTDGGLAIPNNIEFPFLPGNSRTGSGNNLQFEKGSVYQKIISTQDGTESVPTVERLVVSGGDSYNNEGTYTGEGGDLYLWAGRGADGGDIKVDAGNGTNSGGTVKVRAGQGDNGYGGFVEISSGYGASGNGGAININSGYGSNQGGNIAIQAGNGGSAGGNISLSVSAGSWTFKQNGALAFTNGSEQTRAYTGIIEITYSELVYKIGEAQLIKGEHYLITDFKTCYDVPEYYINGNRKDITAIEYHEGPIEPIIVFATNSNSISSSAYQPAYPNDRIQYDWRFATTDGTGGPAYGRISERIDEFNNRTDYDHRNIYFSRFQSYDNTSKLTGNLESYNSSVGILTGTGTSYLTQVSVNDILTFEYQYYQAGVKVVSVDSDTQLTVVVDTSFGSTINFTGGSIELFKTEPTGYYNEHKEVYIGQKDQEDFTRYLTFRLDGSAIHNYIGDYSKFYLNENGSGSGFLLANNVFYSENSRIYSNTIGDRSYNNTGRYWFLRNTITGRFYNNKIYQNGFYGNNIGEYFYDNIIRSSMSDNKIGDNFYQNKIYSNSYFYYNNIGNDFYQNKINSNASFYYNNIGNEFYNNDLYYEVRKNSILNGFNTNTIGSSISQGNVFENNQIMNNFKGNNILGNFWNNQIKSNFKGNEISDEFGYNNIGFGFFANNTPGLAAHNEIGDYFEFNNFQGSFVYNTIGTNFTNNQIKDGFGFGNSTSQGNKIGHNFKYNNIGEYFYNNSIGDNFNNNTLTNYFQKNRISDDVNYTNFNEFAGNITDFTWGGATGGYPNDNTYTGLTGSTNGIGINATFDIVVSSGSISNITINSVGELYSVGDTVTISGYFIGGKLKSISSFTSNGIGKLGSEGVYSGLSTTSNGQGINATFDITVDINGLVTDIQLNNVGSNYLVGNTLTILGSQFGGTDDITIEITGIYSDDIVINISEVSTPSVYLPYNCEIFKRADLANRLSFYDTNDMLIIKNINE